ncbi:outer membrane beta-barrel protein [Nafulsella turpanensis]|uniref:outer membrane beta-barrel protein n=1 Tax=Nafulsella turpanensis TaxID=1265690 RepID=UPI00034B3FBE|nr:outer membrane beta-barrel family protein [Nafulsella turpanensis]
MKRLFLVLLNLLLSLVCFAQIEIKGFVKDSNGPIPYVHVVLLDSSEAIKAYDITDDNGFFLIETEKGKYTLSVSSVGYEKFQQEVVLNENQELEDIVLNESAVQLDEMVVEGNKPLIERTTDRTVFNVENSVVASGGNALSALNAAPGLQIDPGSISLVGRGDTRVMIDGRLLQLTGEELVNFLQSISADDIKKIEIFTNPPAKYEAAGKGGIINIIYKKGKGDFWKNSTTLAYNQNLYSFFNFGNSFFYNKNKIRAALSLNGVMGNERNLEFVKTDYSEGLWKSELDVKQQKNDFSGRLLLDYHLTSKTMVGVQYLSSIGEPDRLDKAVTNVFNNFNALDSTFISSGTNERNVASHLLNFHTVSSLDTMGRSISFDFDYFSYDNNLNRSFIVNIYSPLNELIGINQAAINLSDQSIDNFNAKVDVEHPLTFVNLSYGASIGFTNSFNDLDTYNNINVEEPVFDPALSNEFEYEEKIQAAYLSGSKKVTEKVEVKAGVRVENTITTGFSRTLNQLDENDYLKAFPTFYLLYRKSQEHHFSFSYGRRIERPNFRDLNPFRFYSNSNSYSEGNPFLQPSFSDNFELNHYANKIGLTSNVFLNITTDGFGTIFSPEDETNVQAIIRRNYYTKYSGGIAESYIFNRISWWESQNQAVLFGNKVSFENNIDATPRNGWGLYLETNNTFSLSKQTKFQVDFFYSSPFNNGLYSFGRRYGLDFGIRQSLFDENLQLSLIANDVFDTGSLNNLVSEVNDVEVNFSSNYSRRFLRLSVVYSFGNNKINVRERNFGNEDTKRRSGG